MCSLTKYWDHPYKGDVPEGSTILVVFTTERGKVPIMIHGVVGMPPIKFWVYFNVLGVVILAEPKQLWAQVPLEELAEDFRVDSVKELHESED